MKRILAITAHPDDESFMFGGALALHARAGGKAGLLCLTDGQVGRTGGLCRQEELGPLRREELRRAVAVLGFPHLFTPGLMDKGLDAYGDERGTALVREHIERFGADILLTFGPEGASGHEDHKACWRWTLAAAGDRRLYASSWPPGVELPRRTTPLPPTTVVDVTPLGDLKRRAFLEHRTQQYHLERHTQIMAAFDGKEHYHRVQPEWTGGEELEAGLDPD